MRIILTIFEYYSIFPVLILRSTDTANFWKRIHSPNFARVEKDFTLAFIPREPNGLESPKFPNLFCSFNKVHQLVLFFCRLEYQSDHQHLLTAYRLYTKYIFQTALLVRLTLCLKDEYMHYTNECNKKSWSHWLSLYSVCP